MNVIVSADGEHVAIIKKDEAELDSLNRFMRLVGEHDERAWCCLSLRSSRTPLAVSCSLIFGTVLRKFTEEQLALGAAAKGIEGMFALQFEVSAVTLSHIKSSRNISDKVARQIEARTGKAAG